MEKFQQNHYVAMPFPVVTLVVVITTEHARDQCCPVGSL